MYIHIDLTYIYIYTHRKTAALVAGYLLERSLAQRNVAIMNYDKIMIMIIIMMIMHW